jgi:2-pyrone-4,6-dicarboxylate lactonase
MRSIIDRVAPLGWHVEWHFDAQNVIEYQDLFEQMPIPVVLDHMGRVPASEGLEQPAFQVLCDLFDRLENLWIKISGAERITRQGPPFDDAVPFARALVEIAPERLLWGTDWPHPNVAGTMPNDGDLVDLIPRMVTDGSLQKQILVENPTRLYGFNPNE